MTATTGERGAELMTATGELIDMMRASVDWSDRDGRWFVSVRVGNIGNIVYIWGSGETFAEAARECHEKWVSEGSPQRRRLTSSEIAEIDRRLDFHAEVERAGRQALSRRAIGASEVDHG